MFGSLRNYIKDHVAYVIYIAVTVIFLLIYISYSNPGNIYISDPVRTLAQAPTTVSAGSWCEMDVDLTHDKLWGISAYVDCGLGERSLSSYPTTRQYTGIIKGDAPDPSEGTECIYAALYAGDELIADWAIPASEIREGSQTKFAFSAAKSVNAGEKLVFAVSHDISGDTEVSISEVSPIRSRIGADVFKKLYVLIALIVIGLAVYLGQKRTYARAYLVMGVIFAVLWMLAMPFNRVPDEKAHLYRIYEIAEGHLTTDVRDTENAEDVQADGEAAVMNGNIGRELPYGIDMGSGLHTGTVRDVVDRRALEIDPAVRTWYSYSGFALYSPVSYLPQVIGIWLAHLFTHRVIVIIYAGRILAAAFTVLMMYLSIRLVPGHKAGVFMAAMLPMMFQQGVSVSADVCVNAVAVFMICYCLYLCGAARVGRRDIVILWVLCTALALCKVVYLPFCFVPFMIPADRFDTPKKRIGLCGGMAATGVIVNLIWTAVADIGSTASSGQVIYILKHPGFFIQTVVRTVLSVGTTVTGELLGADMGGLNIPVPAFPLVLYGLLMLILMTVPFETDARIRPSHRLGLAAIWILTLALTFAGMYLGYNGVGANIIVGFQGRYLIPLVIPALLSFESVHMSRRISDATLSGCVYVSAAAVNIYAIITVLNHTLW